MCSTAVCDNLVVPFPCSECTLEFCLECFEDHLALSRAYNTYVLEEFSEECSVCLYCYVEELVKRVDRR